MEYNYLNLLKHVLEKGTPSQDRTGTGTLSVFGAQMRFDLSQGFPAITTKKLAWKAVKSELLWFIEGSGDERRLCEILHGTRDPAKNTIWTDNAIAPYWQPKAKFFRDLGRVYGVQWRHWRRSDGTEVDQLKELIELIKKDPTSRRLILTAWNPAELDQMALPPCHTFSQFYVRNNQLSCQLYQRSADLFLGVPFNIASYALFTHLIAQVCDLEVGEFVHTFGDAHIYNNHLDQVLVQLSRTPNPPPKLILNKNIKDIDKFTMNDINLENYHPYETISAKMAV